MTVTLRIAALFSGGKDSSFAVWLAQMQGWDIATLVTVFPESHESWMFHYPALKWTGLQADAMGIPQTTISTKGEKEKELADLTEGLEKIKRSLGIDAVVSGAVASEYQRTRVDNICENIGVRSFAPLWHKNQERLVAEQIESGFEIILTSCNALGLGKEWLGKKLEASDLSKLVKLRERYGVSVAFEGGEAETFVLGGPIFKKHLSVIRSSPSWSGYSGHLELEEVHIE